MRVLVADDVILLVRSGLARPLADAGVDVVGEAAVGDLSRATRGFGLVLVVGQRPSPACGTVLSWTHANWAHCSLQMGL